MPSPEAIEAMKRIAREKAGTPEGDVAKRKLEQVPGLTTRPIGEVHLEGRTAEGLFVNFTFDMNTFVRAMEAMDEWGAKVATLLAQKMGDAIDEQLLTDLIEPGTKGS